MFQGKHPKDSKYLSESFKHRSKIFRPKTRSFVRKNEAAAAAAFFANSDVVSTEAVNPLKPEARAGSDLMKEVLNYRLQKTIPWFQILIGAVQDAQVTGVVASYQYWVYKEKITKSEVPLIDPVSQMPVIIDGKPMMTEVENRVVLKDKPCIELLPIENIRISLASDWLDPIGTSPVVTRMIPMFVMDIKGMMEKGDPKTGQPKWKKVPDSQIKLSCEQFDSTRMIREKDKQDPKDEEVTLSDHQIAWVHENFIREDDGIKVMYTLGTLEALTDAIDIEEVYFHGEIPITMGCAVIETHRVYPSSLVEIGGELQREANEIANQRLDNVKLALNKRFVVKRGAQVDLQSLVRNVPASVTMATDPNMDVREMEFGDVTSSSYAEQDRINLDLDELVGNFSSGSVQSNRKIGETVGGMAMISSGASQMTEYMLRTITETWVEPTLRQLVKLESAYETDETILAIAADKAKLFPKYGISQATDDLLKHDLTITVNVGLGATDPNQRLNKFLAAAKTTAEIIRMLPGSNTAEIQKEVFSLAGYKDGERFFMQQQLPPQVQQGIQQMQQKMGQLEQQLQQAQQALKDKSAEIQLEQQKAVADARLGRWEAEQKAQREAERLALEARVAKAEFALKQYREEMNLKLKAQNNRDKNQVDREKNRQNAIASVAGQNINGIEQFVSLIADRLTAIEKRLPA